MALTNPAKLVTVGNLSRFKIKCDNEYRNEDVASTSTCQSIINELT